MISERKKMLLWLMIEDCFDIKPRECGTIKRDKIEDFFFKVENLFDEDRDFREIQLCELRSVVNDLEYKLVELEELN